MGFKPGLNVLNCGRGDLKIEFDKDDPLEVERARRVIQDMLKRGYILFVDEGDGNLKKVRSFNAKRNAYVIADGPLYPGGSDVAAEQTEEEAVPKKKATRKRRTREVPVKSAKATGIAPQLEGEDELTWDDVRRAINQHAESQGEWAGVPLPIEHLELVVEPRYPNQSLNGASLAPVDTNAGEVLDELQSQMSGISQDDRFFVTNGWFCRQRNVHVMVWHNGDGRARLIKLPGPTAVSHIDNVIRTIGASQAWSVDAELQAMNTLREYIPEHSFNYYLTTGSFLETSPRSGVTYLFRRCRPTVALREDAPGKNRVLAALCLHPIGYYRDSFGGAMVPTDDVIAHLLLMRGDEHGLWKKANHHAPVSVASGCAV